MANMGTETIEFNGTKALARGKQARSGARRSAARNLKPSAAPRQAGLRGTHSDPTYQLAPS